MANLQLPYGFRHTGFMTGHPANFGNSKDKIAAAYSTPIYFGDPVLRVSTGYLQKAPAGATQIHGIFIGCQYLSTVKGYTNYSNFFPGNGDPQTDAIAWVISTLDASFQVQTGNSATSASPAALAAVGQNIGLAYGTPNTRTGISAAYADLSTLGTSNTLPFKVAGLVSDPPSVNGADTTTAFNDIVVVFNNTDYRAGTTGI